MAKKLGKKARKFAKKNLQSVLKRKRKLKSMFKKKASKRDEQSEVEDQEEDRIDLHRGRNPEIEDVDGTSLDAVFGENDSDVEDDDVQELDSDGYLSEDASFTFVDEAKSESHLSDEDMNPSCSGNDDDTTLAVQNREIHLELAKKMKKLDRLKTKDPEFSKFLESNHKRLNTFKDEENYSDEDDTSDEDAKQFTNENSTELEIGKLSSSAVDSLYQLAEEHHNVPALIKLLNGYRAACHYGTESSQVIENSGTLSKILMVMLRGADNIFRQMLGLSGSKERKEAILELRNTSKFKTLQPLIKSYLKSTLFLLNEVTDSGILAFALTRLRASVIFFSAFHPLLQRLVKISVHLWATGEGVLSQHSFLIMQDVAVLFNSECYDTCLIKAYKAFIGHCKFVEPVLFKHIQFMKSSFVELCSQDVQKSLSKAILSIQQLSKILRLGVRTKKKEALKNICSWQFASCIDLWVGFISAHVCDYDLQALLHTMIQIINGVAVLFPGPRYLPLRVKCVQWLSHLSSSSGIFIPIASLILDVLEYKIAKESSKPGKDFSFSSAVKLPKHWLKSRNFQEECVNSTIELLSVHFAQWSYHISFPELATIPLIRLRKFIETTTIESFRHIVKRFIDQVEHNIEYVRKKRDDVAFSPKDHQSIDSFLQLEKSTGNTPFTHYYRSIIIKAASRNLLMNEKINFLEQKKSKRNRHQLPKKRVDAVNGKGHSA